MVAQNRATLKAEFETGDVPTGTDYGSLIDSSVNLVDTSAQSIAGPLTFAASATFTGTVTAATAAILGGLVVSGAVTAGSIDVLGALTVSGAVSVVGNTNVVGVVTAGSANVKGGVFVSGAVTAGSLAVLGAVSVVTAQTTATASGAVGGSTVPTTATKYLKVTVSGVVFNIALYPSV